MKEEALIYRLRKRAEIRRNINTRKSVQEGKPDRIAELLEEAADEIYKLESVILEMHDIIDRLERRLNTNDD
jgi:adenylate kinase